MPILTREETSLAVRRGINRVLRRALLPAETDGWEKRQEGNAPAQPQKPERLVCGRYIREELRAANVPAAITRKMKAETLASPGEKPGTIKNVVDHCFGLL